MIHFQFVSETDIANRVSPRDGETKLGETLQYVSSLDAIASSTAPYVIFGIEEDIGVRANYGKKGASKAWNAFLNAFIQVQANKHNVSQMLLLGHIKVVPHASIKAETPKSELGDMVSRIDKMVAQVVKIIVAAGKIPIIIGGGHNNAYGNLKGSSLALGKAVHALNIDAHTDLRTANYRHSGNGFRYAMEDAEGPFLDKYSIFGLHKNYTPTYIFEWMDTQKNRIAYQLFEDMTTIDQTLDSFQSMVKTVHDGSFGLELDCDAIVNFPSSAQTPSGFDLNTTRTLVQLAGREKKCCYFHICEAAPNKKNAGQVGKALSYLVTDFIRAHGTH
jgi:formiminoglutamase